LIPERLRQGDVIRLEFDRTTAPVGIDIVEGPPLDEDLARIVRLLQPEKHISDDFSASAYILEFIVATGSGVLASTIATLISDEVRRRARRKSVSVRLEMRPNAPGANRLVRIAVTEDVDE